jgi:hypothetical protein
LQYEFTFTIFFCVTGFEAFIFILLMFESKYKPNYQNYLANADGYDFFNYISQMMEPYAEAKSIFFIFYEEKKEYEKVAFYKELQSFRTYHI